MSDETQPASINDELYNKIHKPLMELFLENARENESDRRHSRDSTSGIAAAEAAKALIQLERLRLGLK